MNDLSRLIGHAINANNGQCAVIEQALLAGLSLEDECARLRALLDGFAARCAAQAELLARLAESPVITEADACPLTGDCARDGMDCGGPR